MIIDFSKVIKRPIVTEKSSFVKDLNNQVTFEVFLNATKSTVKAAVEAAFKVKVKDVRTMVVHSRTRKPIIGRKRIEAKASNWKKAVVTLMPGENIEVIEGV